MLVSGHAPDGASHPPTGEVLLHEYGYGLGPPTGILLLHYPRQEALDFVGVRDDYLHQLYWSPDGLLAVNRGAESGFVGPDDAFWVRRGVIHEVRSGSGQEVYRVFLREIPAAIGDLAAATVSFAEEARGLVRRLCRPGVREDWALTARAAVLDGLGVRAATPLGYRAGGTGLAGQVAHALAADPADPSTLEQWASRLHTSAKTLQRDFRREFGASYSTVRTQLRLRAAEVLLESLSVTEVAHRVGYSSPSSFVAAFSRERGHTPGRLHRAC